VYQLAQDKLKGIEADIEALKRTKRYVKKVLCDWEQRIESAGFRVRDLDKMAAQLQAAGIAIKIDPQSYPNGGGHSPHPYQSCLVQIPMRLGLRLSSVLARSSGSNSAASMSHG
jgi:hypothetical protein